MVQPLTVSFSLEWQKPSSIIDYGLLRLTRDVDHLTCHRCLVSLVCFLHHCTCSTLALRSGVLHMYAHLQRFILRLECPLAVGPTTGTEVEEELEVVLTGGWDTHLTQV